jgi:hypothetical protein
MRCECGDVQQTLGSCHYGNVPIGTRIEREGNGKYQPARQVCAVTCSHETASYGSQFLKR